MEQPKQPEIKNEKKEYTFEDGIREIMNRIEELFKTQDIAVVTVTGSLMGDINVGKSMLTGSIFNICQTKNIQVFSSNSSTTLSYEGVKNLLESGNRDKKSKKAVILMGAASSPSDFKEKKHIDKFREYTDKMIQYDAKQASLDIPGIDIRIFIYRPDRKLPTFGDVASADVVIRNDMAKNVARLKFEKYE